MSHRITLRRAGARASGVCLALWCLISAPARAELVASVELTVTDGRNQTAFYDNNTNTDPTGNLVGASLTAGLPYIDPSVSARATYGTLRAGSRADSNLPGDPSYYYLTPSALARASFSDTFVPLAPGVPTNAAGTMTVRGRLTASFGYDNQGYGTVTSYDARGDIALDLAVSSGIGTPRIQQGYTAFYHSDGSSQNSYFDITGTGGFQDSVPIAAATANAYNIVQDFALEVPIVFGSPATLTASLQTIASSLSFGDPGAGLDFNTLAGNTFVLQGITDVKLSDGTPVAGFTAIGLTSGVDFASVPEPASWVMMASGLLLLARVTRRRRACTKRAPDTNELATPRY